MSDSESFENLILGGGEAGKNIAWDLARAGRRTAVIERGLIGGACPNIACMPSKNLIHSARVADFVHHADAFGQRTGPAATDMGSVRQRKREMVAGMVAIHRTKFAANGLAFLLGEGRFVAPRAIEVQLAAGGARRLEGERIFLDLGTRATVPDIPGLAAAAPLTHVEALEFDRLPAHLLVLGGGYVGLELAQAFRRFGSRVTVIEQGPQLMAREDPDVAEAIRMALEEDGLEVAGVDLDRRGYVQVNERLETTAPGIWAMGDCAGSPQFTHVALDDFRIVRDNLTGHDRATRDRQVPYCMFTDPPLGRVGLSETKARARGTAVRVARLPMASVLRARTIGETRGSLKALIDGRSDRILGFTMLGPEAGEVVAVVQTAMLAGLPYTALRDAILTHPTHGRGPQRPVRSVPAT